MTGGSVSFRYAVRNLFRNGRRTLLSVAGVAVGCTVALVSIGMSKGKVNMFIRSIGEGGVGHMRVVREGWLESRRSELRVADWKSVLERARADPAVAVATPRTRVQGMLAMGTRLTGVEIVGVDPATEPKAYRYVRTMAAGRYLVPSDRRAIVIGRTLANRLRVEPGDQVVASAADASGSVRTDMFEVVGIVDLGGKLDAAICQAVLADAAWLSGVPGAGEIALLLKNPGEIDLVRGRIACPRGDAVVTWAQISPQSAAGVRINEAWQWIVSAILIVVVLLGVASAQLTAVLERRREFAVLAALGMGRWKMTWLVLGEAVALGTASLAVTMLLSVPLDWYFATTGITVMAAGGMSVADIAIVDTVFRSDFGRWLFVDGAVLAYTATVLASLYPAWFAARLDPAAALRVAG